MPRKKIRRTPFGAIVEPLGCYIVRVAYHRDEDFATNDASLLRGKLDAFDRYGWKYRVDRLDFHHVPELPPKEVDEEGEGE